MLQNTIKIVLYPKNSGNRSGKCGYLCLKNFLGFWTSKQNGLIQYWPILDHRPLEKHSA